MQNAPPPALSGYHLLAYAITAILSASIGFFTAWLNRKKPQAEVHESEARTQRTLAEVRSIDLQSNLSAGDMVLRMVDRLSLALARVDELQKENDELRESVADRERLANENEAYEKQIRWAKATFKLKQIPWDDTAAK